MNLYLAGNFPSLNDPPTERGHKEFVEKQGLEYKRLVSFFFPKHCDTVLSMKEERCGNCAHAEEALCYEIQPPNSSEISDGYWCLKWQKKEE